MPSKPNGDYTARNAHSRIDVLSTEYSSFREEIKEDIGEIKGAIKDFRKWAMHAVVSGLVAIISWLGLQVWDRVQIKPTNSAYAAEHLLKR